MNTNFYQIELCGAAYDAQQFKAMRQARLFQALRNPGPALLDNLLRFFDRFYGAIEPAAANA